MQGRRAYPDESGEMPLQAGEYGRLAENWWVRPPCGGVSAIPADRVIDHEDGTISVCGFLRLPKWEGYLDRGAWTEVPRAEPSSQAQ